MLGVVVGMAALAIDGSRAYALRRDFQNAVDYAALAAADTYQQTGSFATAESTAATDFGVQMRLYSPSCGGFGSPGPGTFTVNCTYPDGTTLAIQVPVGGAHGAQFNLTATRTLSLQFGRILTNGSTPPISATSSSRVNNLLYSPTVAALDQAGCGGAAGTAITINGFGSLKLVGDMVSDGTVSVSSGTGLVAGDVYARCQASVSGVTPVCYPSGANPACTYPDVAGAVCTGYHYLDPGYPAPAVGASQAVPGNNVIVAPGVYTSNVNVSGDLCFFLAGGVYDFQAGAVNAGALVSNELKPPDEPVSNNSSMLASPQFWNSSGARCAGSAQYTAVQCTGNNNCGTGNCGNGQGNGNGNGCSAAPPGDWSFEVTSTRTDTYNGNTYQRESAPSTCHTVHVGNNQAVQLIVSNVPGATSYNVYAAMPGTFCNGPFGLADMLPVSVAVQNNNLAGCPAFTGTACSLGFETITLNGYDIGSPFAPNAGASPGTTGAYPPNSETAPLLAGHPNQNPPRLSGAAGDRANENNCESTAGAYATCPAAVTPGAVELYFPGSSCLSTTNLSDTYLFSGYQYDWVVAYAPASNHCANSYGADQNSALIGLTYMPGASLAILDAETFDCGGTGGVIADTLSFSGSLPAITYNAAYAPVPFAARLVS
jgi:Putative Flp pilus-assembly TadE/G-like